MHAPKQTHTHKEEGAKKGKKVYVREKEREW